MGPTAKLPLTGERGVCALPVRSSKWHEQVACHCRVRLPNAAPDLWLAPAGRERFTSRCSLRLRKAVNP